MVARFAQQHRGRRTRDPILRKSCATPQRVLSAAAMLWSVSAARADDLPPELRVIVTPDLPADPTETADNNLLALNSAMFDLYGASGAIFQANFLAHHPVILGLVLGRRRAFHPLSPGPAAARRPAGADRLSAPEVGRAQHHGPGRGGDALYREPQEPVLARLAPGLSQPHAIRSRQRERDRHAGGLEGEQCQHPAEQYRLHGSMRRRRARSPWPICRTSPRSRRRC